MPSIVWNMISSVLIFSSRAYWFSLFFLSFFVYSFLRKIFQAGLISRYFMLHNSNCIMIYEIVCSQMQFIYHEKKIVWCFFSSFLICYFIIYPSLKSKVPFFIFQAYVMFWFAIFYLARFSLLSFYYYFFFLKIIILKRKY